MHKQYLEAGMIVNTHGLLGEVKIMPWCDSPEFLRGFSRLFIEEKEYRIISSRIHKSMLLAVIEGIDTVEKAISYKNKKVFIDRNDADLPEGTYFIQDLIGLDIYDIRQDRMIGNLKEVLQRPANDVYIVGDGDKEYMIPVVSQFVKRIDIEKSMITVETIEGMNDED